MMNRMERRLPRGKVGHLIAIFVVVLNVKNVSFYLSRTIFPSLLLQVELDPTHNNNISTSNSEGTPETHEQSLRSGATIARKATVAPRENNAFIIVAQKPRMLPRENNTSVRKNNTSIARKAPVVHQENNTYIAQKALVASEENSTSFDHWVQVAVVSDRKSSIPLLGLVNSILMYTTSPVAFHIFTEHPYAFLENIEKKTPHVRVYYYSSRPNIRRAWWLIRKSKFRTLHSSRYPSMSRLFIGQTPFQPIGTVPKVIIVDDDILFYRDIAELWEILMVNHSKSNPSLFCPRDGNRIRKWVKWNPGNGDMEGKRYCQGGLMALPVASYPGAVNSSKWFWDATFDMTAQYPNATYHLAHQQILNRMFVKHKATIDLIPCNWHGDTHTCKLPMNCNCKGESYTYHFLKKKYLRRPHMFSKERPSWAFSYYTNITVDSIIPSLTERIRGKEGGL